MLTNIDRCGAVPESYSHFTTWQMLAHGSNHLLTTMADSEATLWDISLAGSSSSSSPYARNDSHCRPYSPTNAVGTVQWLNFARTKPRRVCTVLGLPKDPRSVHFAPFGSSQCLPIQLLMLLP